MNYMGNETSISIVDKAEHVSDALINREIAKKFSSPLMGFSIKLSDYEPLIATLNENYTIIREEYKISKFSEVIHLREKDENFIIMGGISENKFSFDIYCVTNEVQHFVFNKIKKFFEISSSVEIVFRTAGMNNSGLFYNVKILNSDSFKNVSSEYYPYININEMFSQFFKFKENILCLAGVPGCGKSKMASLLMDYMIENEYLLDEETFDYNVLYVKSTDALVSDDLWNSLDSTTYDLVILDDLDYFLGTRGTITSQEDRDKNKFISNLLSYTDGVQENKTKFIITTNQPIKDIDSAILRKGRMFDILELRPLKLEEAKNIWTSYDLDIEDYPKDIETESVLQADLGQIIEGRLNKTERNAYLLENGISKINEYRTPKKVGL